MKLYSVTLLLLFCFLVKINNIEAQPLVKNTYGTSNIFEADPVGIILEPLIGVGTVLPTAKLHIFSQPVNGPTLKLEANVNNNNSFSNIGMVEFWKKDGNKYYGIYQSQSGYQVQNYFENNVGINVSNPTNKLDVNGIIGCTGDSATGIKISNSNKPFVFQYIDPGSGGGGANQETQQEEGDPVQGGATTFSPLTISANGIKVQSILECTSLTNTRHLKINYNPFIGSVFMCDDSSGNGKWTNPSIFSIIEERVGIGIENSYPDYKLAVNGKIICEELKVKLLNQWPDFVFNQSYHLRSLKEVDEFIQKNKHLPDMPSAKEVSENGINIGEMNARLLQKVEELTRYLISLEKEVDQLKAKVASR